MSFKEKMLLKSNSYAYYKNKSNHLQNENNSLKRELESIKNDRRISLRDEYFRKYENYKSICNK